MRVVKKVLSGSLDLEPEAGKIWLNDLNGCVLRISNLNFKNTLEKFDLIEINGNNTYMIKGNNSLAISEEILGKIEEVVNLLLFKVSRDNKPREFLKNVSDMINKFILER